MMNKNMQAKKINDDEMKAYTAHMEAIGYYISPLSEGGTIVTMPHHPIQESSYYFYLDEYGDDDDLPAAFQHLAHDDTDDRKSSITAIRKNNPVVPLHPKDLKGTQYSDIAVDPQEPPVEKLRIYVDTDLSDTCDETHDDSTGFEVDLVSEHEHHFGSVDTTCYARKIHQVESS